MKQFDGQTLDVLRAELNEVLKPLSEKHGISFDIGRMSYESDNVRFTVTSNVVPEGVDPQYAEDYRSLEKYGRMYGLSTDDFMKVVEKPGGNITILGVNPKSPKYCINGMKDGKRFRFTEGTIANYLKKKNAA